MRCYFCTHVAVATCRECGKPICQIHDRRGTPRDTRHNGGLFFRHDYCHPCYNAIHEDAMKCNLIMCAILLPVMLLLMAVTMAR